jgi:hypothetical protein
MNETIQGRHPRVTWIFPLSAGVILAFFVMLHAVPGIPTVPILQALGVPALPHPFMDLHGVASWCELFRSGGDPAHQETVIIFPGEDPHPNFRMNYSPCVFLLSYLGLHHGTVPLWGVILAVVYLVAVWVVALPRSFGTSLFWLAATFSPASALVMERANLDTLIFAMIAAALVLRKRPPFEGGVILSASFFKFFPVAALGALWFGGRRGGRITACMAAGIFCLLLTVLGGRLWAIAGSLQGQDHTAFGTALPACLLADASLISPDGAAFLRSILMGIAVVLAPSLFLLGFLSPGDKQTAMVSERNRHALLLGAPVFLLLFLSGNQMDYKVIFLFFMLPGVLELRSAGKSLTSTAATCWIILLGVYSYWTFFSDEGSLRNALLKQAVMWGVFALSAMLTGKMLSSPYKK